MRRVSALSAVAIFLFAFAGMADEKISTPAEPAKTDERGARLQMEHRDADADGRIESLIKRLAAEKKPSRIPPAWHELRKLGIDAFPVLAGHFADKEYSFSADTGSTDWDWTVGHACFDLVWTALEPYNMAILNSSIPPEKYWWRRPYCREFLNTPDKAQQWMRKRDGKTLAELQIEILEWVTTHRSERKAEISAEDKGKLVEMLDTLKKTKQPLKPTVPWSM